MKNWLSLLACFVICGVLLQYRFANISPQKPLKITEWDANGYYLYLPSILLYHDYKKLEWLETIDQKYRVTGGSGHGGDGYQVKTADNGNYVFMYQGGVAIMELPFYFVAHFIATHSSYPPDGFSPPYQYSLAFGIIFYSLLAALMIRRVLLIYFSDIVATITLLLVCLATNFIQYSAVDSGQSHAYIFLLYPIVLYATYKWHQRPSAVWAGVLGFVCGLATACRPTEAIVIFIPIFWDTHTREAAREKWAKVRSHRLHIVCAALFGLIGVLPQLLYWKAASGNFVFDVGSKWKFLNPYFRVLFGFEKGWFIYTPITLFFVAGMFFMKGRQFRKSVLWFCLLNIYIVIAWDDWRYGGSYSTRALVQSYPVFALPLASMIEVVLKSKWKVPFLVVAVYLTDVNLFQITQYGKTVLHYNDMNRKYYARIYLNPNPGPIDFSVIDSNDVLSGGKLTANVLDSQSTFSVHAGPNAPSYFIDRKPLHPTHGNEWIRIECAISSHDLWQTYLNAELKDDGRTVKHSRVRLFNPISDTGKVNTYAFWMKLPGDMKAPDISLYITTPFNFDGTFGRVKIERYVE